MDDVNLVCANNAGVNPRLKFALFTGREWPLDFLGLKIT